MALNRKTSVSFTIPNADAYISSTVSGAVIELKHGVVLADKVDFVSLFSVVIDAASFSRNNHALSLTAHADLVAMGVKSVRIEGVSAVDDGVFKCTINRYLRVGDNAVFDDGATLAVNEIFYTINPHFAAMEIS